MFGHHSSDTEFSRDSTTYDRLTSNILQRMRTSLELVEVVCAQRRASSGFRAQDLYSTRIFMFFFCRI